MADNYLENKMEEHRRGTVRYAPVLGPSRQAKGTAILPFEPCVVAIYGDDRLSEPLERAAVMLRNTGSRVAVLCSDLSYGRALSQRNSLTFVPAKELPESFPKPDIIIRHSDYITAEIFGRVFTIDASESTPDDIANTIIYLSLPSSRVLDLPAQIKPLFGASKA